LSSTNSSGEWVDHEKHGKGVMTYANKDVYDGEWIEYRKHGQGVMKYHNGDVYSGGWRGGKKHGKGIFKYTDGDVLKSIGEWKEGKKDGVFEDVIRTSKQVIYENDKVKTSVKRESTSDIEDFIRQRQNRSKRIRACASNPQLFFESDSEVTEMLNEDEE